MRRFTPSYLLLAGFVAVIAALPAAAAPDKPAAQTLTVNDSRTGTGPCGFSVRRDIHGTIEVITALDGAGNLSLAIDRVSLQGALSNSLSGKSVELKWVHQNGIVGFAVDGSTTSVAFALTGEFLRGYDDLSTGSLSMDLPADGAEILTFNGGESSDDPWTHICGLLA